MNLLITGATGFIGRKLVDLAVARNWQVTAVVRDKSALHANKVNTLVADISEYSQLGKSVGSVDCMVHLAWNGVRGEKRLDNSLQRSNYEYSMKAIRSMVDAGCKKIILAGSQAEYGVCAGEILESTPCKPNTAYGYYKLKLYEDAMALCRQNGMKVKDARFFSLYGPGDYEKTAVMQCVRNMLMGKPCELTVCTQMWDYLYVDDAVRAVLSLCVSDCQDGAYNVASGDCRPLSLYIEEMKKVLNSNSELRYGAVPNTKAGPISICPSIKKITDATGWKPTVSFSEGVKQVAASLQNET